MDKVTKYVYAIGTGAQLQECSLECLAHSENLRDLNICDDCSLILTPRFVGVYQLRDIVAHTKDEREEVKEVDRFYALWGHLSDSLANTLLASKHGTEDPVNPNLIHVAHYSSGLSNAIARLCLSDELGRLAISHIGNLPDFYEKQTETVEEALEKMHQGVNDNLDREEITKIIKPDVVKLETQQTLYGLTRSEYAFLRVMQDIRDGKPSVLSHPLVKSAFSPLLK